jgi:hypothetical protein
MLFVVMLGGRHPQAKIEVHDVAFSFAKDICETYPFLRKSWFGSPDGLHIDSWIAVDGVDGFKLTFERKPPRPGSPRLFFINMGGYDPGVFGEMHNYFFVVAKNLNEAKIIAKTRRNSNFLLPHIDSISEIDECFSIRSVDGLYIHMIAGDHKPISFNNDYIILS